MVPERGVPRRSAMVEIRKCLAECIVAHGETGNHNLIGGMDTYFTINSWGLQWRGTPDDVFLTRNIGPSPLLPRIISRDFLSWTHVSVINCYF